MKEWYEKMLAYNAEGLSNALKMAPEYSSLKQDAETALQKLADAILSGSDTPPGIWKTVMRATAKNMDIFSLVEPCPKQ